MCRPNNQKKSREVHVVDCDQENADSDEEMFIGTIKIKDATIEKAKS